MFAKIRLLLISCSVALLLAIGYLFYSNRLLAFLIGYALRFAWWNSEDSQAWVSFGKYPVASVILPKFDEAAHRVVSYIPTCRQDNDKGTPVPYEQSQHYGHKMLHHVEILDLEGKRNDVKSSSLPCRIQISFEGLEWLLYNRTSSYDTILKRFQQRAPGNNSRDLAEGKTSPISGQSASHTGPSFEGRDIYPKSTPGNTNGPYAYPPPQSRFSSQLSRLAQTRDDFFAWITSFKPDLRELLPIGIAAVNGAIVCGNASTPSLAVARFSDAEGSYDIEAARSPYDLFKTIINFKFRSAKIDLEKNPWYRGSLLQQGRLISKSLVPNPGGSKLFYPEFVRLWSEQTRRQMLNKIEDVHAWMQSENETTNDYAIVETIFEAPELEISYYWDELGVVPSTTTAGTGSHCPWNKDTAPQYGLDFIVRRGTARYGPWADRQRFELQRLFFPPAYETAVPAGFLKPGEKRIYTEFKVFVELRDSVNFYVPFKEPSKDWQFPGTKLTGATRTKREGGWIELRAGDNSTITYVTSWVATAAGYHVIAEMHLNEITVLSSVNDIQLLTAQSLTALCSLPVPLIWNEARRWTFDLSFQKTKLNIIRDHINLFTDLGKDWTSGPPADFDRWIPMHYLANVTLQNFELTLFLNDHNIITHPELIDANTLLTLHGEVLRTHVDIPSTVFRPEHTIVPFWIEVPGVNFRLTLPKWNTHAIFKASRTTDFAFATLLRLDASYLYHSDTRPEFIDQLRMEGLCSNVVFVSFGWVIRHLMTVRENYFGNFTHFSTLSEYIAKRNRNQPVGDPVELKWREGKSNIFEVSLGVRFEDSVVVMPAGFPGYEFSLDHPTEVHQAPIEEPKGLGTCVIVKQPELQISLRAHDFSMEMSLNSSPVVTSVMENVMHSLNPSAYQLLSRKKLHIDGINIVANRLFGPQPRTSTYLCIWEIGFGAVSGIVSTMELRGLLAAVAAFRLNFSDDVNAPAKEFAVPPDPDVTFLKVSVTSVDVAWVADHISIYFSLPKGITLDYNDLPGRNYKKVTEVRVKQGKIRALMHSAHLRDSWLEAGSVCFDVGMDSYTSPFNWHQMGKAQMTFISAQDAPTRRAWFLYEDSPMNNESRSYMSHVNQIFLPPTRSPRQNSEFHPHRHSTDAGSYKTGMRRSVEITDALDSEEDERISEADRDARLANSRPETPLLFNSDYDSRSMSSSDESDDADVTTEASESDSDGAENDRANEMDGLFPVPSHYKEIVRRFESGLRDKNAFRDRPLFNLVRDLPVDGARPSISIKPSERDTGEAATKSIAADVPSTTRLIRSNSIDVLLTPLFVHVVRKISEETFIRNLSMEMLVDSFTTAYLNDMPSENNSSSERYDVEVATIRLRILQSLTPGNAFSSFSPPASASEPTLEFPGDSRILSDIDLSLHDPTMTFSQTVSRNNSHFLHRSVTCKGSFSRSTASLDTSMIHAFPRMNKSRKATSHCSFMIEASTIAYNSGVYVNLGDVQVNLLEKISPVMVAATADSLAVVLQQSREMYKNGLAQSNSRKQRLLWYVLQCCRDLDIGDPFTHIQPSYLVQSGRPLQLRLDPSWKMFMYLRNCFRHLNPLDRLSIQRRSEDPPSLPPANLEELYIMLSKRLQEWGHELDSDEIRRLHFLRYFFNETDHSPKRRKRRLPSITFHCGTFDFTIFQRPSPTGEGLHSAISFGPVSITYRRNQLRTTTAVQGPSSSPIAPSMTILDSSRVSCHHVITATMQKMSLAIHPTFIVFLRHLLHLQNTFTRRESTKTEAPRQSIGSPSAGLFADESFDVFFKIPSISVQAAVEGMVLEIGMNSANIAVTLPWTRVHSQLHHKEPHDRTGNGLLKISRLYTRVKQSQEKLNPFQSNERDILTSIIISSATIHLSISGDTTPSAKGLFFLNSVQLSVPRSALLTYRLIEEWRTQYLPNIYSMAQDLLADFGKRSQHGSPLRARKSSTKRVLSLDFQISVNRVGISLQVMHGTWFSWDVYNTMFFVRNAPKIRRKFGITFGVHLSSQLIHIGARPVEDVGTSKTLKLVLPSFSSSGSYDGHHLQSHAIIDYISITLKPRYMDDILTVQHNLGNHFYEILDLIADSRKGRPTARRAPSVPIRYDVAFLLRGFRIGIVGPTTILDLTSAQMTGTAKNEGELAWNFTVSNLALALSHHSAKPRPKSEFDRKLKSAYTVLDLEAHSSPTPSSSGIVSYILRLQVGRMHAVMTPNSVGELGDLIDFIQAEKLLRQEQRALELEEIKNKTKRVMRTFEVEKPAESLKRSTSLLENRTVLLNITDIGIAFPLSLKNEIEVDTIGSVPAFLMSIQKATFSVKRHESGQASMGRLSLQFVEQFDQSHPNQFDGDKHRSRNRLLYPGMKAEFQSGTSTVARQWQVGAHVDGFILDLDPSIVNNVFGLMDVYRKGRERIDRLTMNQESSKFVPEDVPAAVMEASYLAVRTSNILLNIIFQTGKVRLRDVVNSDQTGETWSANLEPGYSPQQVPRSRLGDIDDMDADVIYFPTITVCGEYRATPAASKLSSSQDQESSILIFRSQLHSTINQITPSIFPFLTGITQRIERRLRRAEAQQTTLEDTFSDISATSSQERSEFLTRGVLKGIQLSFSLRIDSSKVELLCGHNLGVVAALHWESGGFVVTLSPKLRAAHFAGSVNGLKVDLRHLKHQGGTVQTAHVDARDVAFSVSYNRTDDDAGHPSDSISVVVDTEFGAALRLDRLQDILIFKAVYIDRLPGTVPQAAGKSAATIETEPQDAISNVRTVILARARAVKLIADLGHNVASAVIDLKTLVFQTHVAPLVTDFALSIGHINLDLEDERPLTGYMRLPEFSFTTIRHNNVQPEIPHDTSRMLDVTLTSGTLDLVLQSEKRIILQYHAKPFDIRIADDWSAMSWRLPPEQRRIRLDFTVTGTDVLAIASLQTIPRIIMLLAKLKSDLEAQRTEARSALATSYITLLPKPENALSEVAEAMIRSARSKLTEGHAFSYVVVQDMTLGLSNLRFVLFKNPNDSEMALFQGEEVNAELRRIVQQLDKTPSRSLKLAFSALNLSKYSALKYRTEDDLQAISWLEHLLKGASEAIIARVPAMHLEMNSDIEYDGRQETLLYDLVATADDTDLISQSIYVSLNLSLYVWAGGLVKGLGLEVEKALMTAGFNKPATGAVGPSSSKLHKDDTQGVKPADPTAVSQVAETHLSSTPVSNSVTRTSSTIPGLPEPETLRPRKYVARSETFIDYGTIQQLGEATPDAKAPWLGLKETVPPRVHEYATLPMEVLMKTLLEVYSKQLTSATKRKSNLEGRRDESDANDPI